ncbi:DEKNAAC103416 [Brettanomyces naardenensis]|uniref:Kinetochore protein SPC25 n=1 Tax=Brettanomyces naardenensis TaxID=13370 RepID=A0A448YP36_BRENA|nr:DEKNAAC103416 [Brettanomyces naardenensis]
MSFPEKQALEESIESFESLKPQMDALRLKVQDHLKRIQSTLITKRASYEKALSELGNHERELQAKIKTYEELERQLSEEVNKEVQDRDNSSMKVREMKLQEEELVRQTKKFKSDIKKLDIEIEQKLRKLNEEKGYIANQTSLIDDKAFQYEQLLGLRIETGGEDSLISFIFKNVDPDDFEREVYFVLDPSEYKTVETSPPLDQEVVGKIMDDFSKHKEIGYLWRDMRRELRRKLLE